MKPIYEPKGRALEYAPLACNLFRGCLHGCTYCFAPSALRMHRDEFHGEPAPRKDILKHLEKQLSTGKFEGKKVLLSFSTDPYQSDGARLVTREALQLFTAHGVHWSVLTKNKLAALDFDLYTDDPFGHDDFGMSMTFSNDLDSTKYEPRATSPRERASTLKAAYDMGIRTWASCEPVIDPSQTMDIIKEISPFVDHFKVGKVNYQKSDVDWYRFASEVVELLDKTGCSYMIKDSLEQYMKEIP